MNRQITHLSGSDHCLLSRSPGPAWVKTSGFPYPGYHYLAKRETEDSQRV